MRKNSFAMRRSFLRVLKKLRLIAKRRQPLSEASILGIFHHSLLHLSVPSSRFVCIFNRHMSFQLS